MTANQYDAMIGNQTMDSGRWTMVYGQWSSVSRSQPYAK